VRDRRLQELGFEQRRFHELDHGRLARLSRQWNEGDDRIGA
jgi:hypothetical protein